MNYKRISLILAIALIIVSVFSLALWLRPEWFKINEQVASTQIIKVNKNKLENAGAANANTPEVSTEPTTPLPTSDEVTDGYLNSKFRVLAVVNPPQDEEHLQNPDPTLINRPDVVIVTERDLNKNGTDTSCGSIYTQPTCYFFIERTHYDPLVPQFVAKLEKAGGLNIGSIKFKDPDSIEFTTSDGDAGYHYEATWRLNLNTGKIIQLSKTESDNN